MSVAPDQNGAGEPLMVVSVTDTIDPALTGRRGASYRSPAQPRGQALELVRLLLGRPGDGLADSARWCCPVAGGRRTVTIEPEGAERVDGIP